MPEKYFEIAKTYQFDNSLEKIKSIGDSPAHNKISEIGKIISEIPVLERGELIAHFNESLNLTTEPFISTHLTNGDILFFNEHNQLEICTSNTDNYEQYLKRIREHTNTTQESAYNFRSDILASSQGSLTTHDVFYNEEIKDLVGIFQKLQVTEKWIKERAEVQNQYLTESFRQMEELSAALENSQKTATLMRGGTAAGKSTYLLQNEPFAQALKKTNGKGIINPDAAKQWLRQNLQAKTGSLPRHDQVHFEGSMLASKQEQLATNSGLSMVIDRRFDKFGYLKSKAEYLISQNYYIDIVDIDTPITLSLVRLLQRGYESESPIVNYQDVVNAYDNTQKTRSDVQLFTSKTKSMGYRLVQPYFQEDDSWIKTLNDTKIDSRLIMKITENFHIDPATQVFLSNFEGMTFKEAINFKNKTLIEKT